MHIKDSGVHSKVGPAGDCDPFTLSVAAVQWISGVPNSSEAEPQTMQQSGENPKRQFSNAKKTPRIKFQCNGTYLEISDRGFLLAFEVWDLEFWDISQSVFIILDFPALTR